MKCIIKLVSLFLTAIASFGLVMQTFFSLNSWLGFAYFIVSNMSVRYDTILLPRCHFELLEVLNSFSL